MTKFFNYLKKNKKFGLNALWSNINQIVITFAALIISVIFTRLGTQELYSQYLFVLGILGIFVIFTIPGIRTLILKNIAQKKEGIYKVGTNYGFIWGLITIPLIIITGLYFYFYRSETIGLALIISSFFFPFVNSLQTWMFALKGRGYFKKLAIFNIIKFSINVITVTIAIVLSKNLTIILATYFIVHSIFHIIYHGLVLKTLNQEIFPKWKKHAFALTIMDFSGMIYGRIDIVLIGLLLPIELVAIYGLTMKFVDIFIRATRSTVEVILPKLFVSTEIKINYFYKYFLISFIFPIILYPIIKYPILLLYGNDYAEVIQCSQLYLLAIPFFFLSVVSTNLIIKHELNKQLNINRIASIIFVLILYFVTIPLWGIYGGIISSILYHVFQVITNIITLKRKKTFQKINQN